MSYIKRKLKSNSGATLMVALLFFVVCAVTGSMILLSASVSSGRLANMKRRDQNYFAVRSAVKMCEQQMKEMNVAFSEKLVETVVETEDKNGETDRDVTYEYSVTKRQFDDTYPICLWIKNENISNYNAKDKADGSDSADAFGGEWFIGMVSSEHSDKKEAVILNDETTKWTIDLSSQLGSDNSEISEKLKELNVEIDAELDSTGVLIYKIHNASEINEKTNKDVYYMTLTVDIEAPSEPKVKVEIDEDVDVDGEGNSTTTTTTTTTFTNDYTFNFKVRDIQKG